MADEHQYAERMFAAPVDLGIAEVDRSVSSVPFGTSSYLEGGRGDGDAWYEGGGAVGERAVQGITIYPPTRGVVTQGDPFEPVKIGVLVDMDLGQLLADWIDPTILAIEDALNEGVFSRGPIQLVIADARGLPRESYRKVIDGYRWLVEQGCVVVLGPLISDNSLVVQDTVNELGVACIGWTGAHKFASDYCFTVANGDIPTEGVMCAQWMADRGFRKVGMFWEQGSSGRDYADYFRDTALQLGLQVVREVKLEPNPKGLVDDLRTMRDLGVETIYYGGYGYATFHFAAAFKELDWDPPRVMGTAFMFYSNSNAWAEGLEGWHGVDQLGEDGANANYNAMVERFEKRFGRSTRNVVVALAYDTARVAIHGIGNAAIPHPRWVKEGMERIRWMPATNGGPGTYIQFGPHDRKGYKGDFLTIRELRGGELRFDGYHRPGPEAIELGVTAKVYIHELIDIIGHNRARYLHHMTANWCPIAREERQQLCLGVWATLGSTGRWPEVVNMWELDGWDGLAANFAHETAGGRDQDPSLAEWWAAASSLRRGGIDRIVVPTAWTRSVEQLTADGLRGEVYAHELVTVPPGTNGDLLDAVEREGLASVQALGLELVGAYAVAMADDAEALLLWAIPDWATWVAYEQSWSPDGALAAWRKTLLGLGASWRRQLLIDSPLNPLRTGRQPQASDRRPLDQI